MKKKEKTSLPKEKPVKLKTIKFTLDAKAITKLEKSMRANQEYKEKTKNANFGEY